MSKPKSFLFRAIPLWLALVIAFNLVFVVGITEYVLLKRYHNQQMQALKLSLDPEALVADLTGQVLPAEGYTTIISWGDLGQKLVAAGAIDIDQYEEYFPGLDIFENPTDEKIAITEANSRGLVNVLWALGLTQKSKVLDEGPMVSGDTNAANFASTGGWTLGHKEAMELYSSQELIPLTQDQQELVTNIAGNVFRPCCGNPTSFPDCNHGMAALGYIELAVFSGLSEEQIYKDLLAFNSFWFPQTYLEMAVYFKQNEGIDWSQVDAKTALSYEYSSAYGAANISKQVQNVPGLQSAGGSCGA